LILVISVFDYELEPIRHEMVTFEEGKVLNRDYIRGVIGRNEIVAASGILGKVEAAFITQKFLDLYNIDCVVLLSGAGAIPENLKIGDLVVGDEYMEYDRQLGNKDCLELFKGCPKLISLLKKDIPEIKVGKIVSGDAIVNSTQRKKELGEKYNALALDMDSAAVAKVAAINGTAFISAKVILDLSDENTNIDFDKYFENYSQIPAQFFAGFLLRHFLKKEC